jgi:hypothetical protein
MNTYEVSVHNTPTPYGIATQAFPVTPTLLHICGNAIKVNDGGDLVILFADMVTAAFSRGNWIRVIEKDRKS